MNTIIGKNTHSNNTGCADVRRSPITVTLPIDFAALSLYSYDEHDIRNDGQKKNAIHITDSILTTFFTVNFDFLILVSPCSICVLL
jgi:hypothetical protein